MLLLSLISAEDAMAEAGSKQLSGADACLSQWKQTNRQLKRLKAQHDELAHRIAALKRVRRNAIASRTLQTRLQESVLASTELEKSSQRRTQQAKRCRADIDLALKKTDGGIAAQKKGLRSAQASVRKKTAKILRRLLGDRARLREMQNLLSQSDETPKSWRQYEVKIDPLDGPNELREKAEFIEDTRDKLKRKKNKLEQLFTERRQMLALAKAANKFQTDMSAFDESTRSGRVERQGERSGALSLPTLNARTQNDAASESSNQASASSATQEAQPQTANAPSRGGNSGTDDSPGADAPETLAGSSDASNAQTNNSVSASSGAVGTSISGGNQSASNWVQQLDPDVLINLKVNELASENMNLDQLIQLMANMDKLDSYLKAHAKNIQNRADKIEEDEKQVLHQ